MWSSRLKRTLSSGIVLAGVWLLVGNPVIGQDYDPTGWYNPYTAGPNAYGVDEIGPDYRSRYFPYGADNDLTGDYDSRYFPLADEPGLRNRIGPSAYPGYRGRDYFTNDWYRDRAGFDDWYGR